MKHILVIAYYFPPEGGAAVYRPLRFVRHLTGLGWHASVMTRAGTQYERHDPALLAAVPEGTDLVRVADRDVWQAIQARRAARFDERAGSNDAIREQLHRAHHRPARSLVRHLVRRAEAWVYYPDRACFWIAGATRAATRICRNTRPDVMLVTGGPWSSFLVARRVSRQTGVPYVLDFRDSWTLTLNEDFEMHRPAWAQRKDRRLLATLFSNARAVVFRYESEAECYWNAYPGALDASRIHIIPNGFDGAVDEQAAPAAPTCTVLYTGTVGPYRYDSLLDALALLRASSPTEAAPLRIRFVGEGVDEVARAAASRGLAGIVQTQGPVSSSEVARLQRDAQALLLLGVKSYQGYELCGSKVFGYLKAGRPIVGVLPDDESRKVLERVGVSTIASIDAPSDIAALLSRILSAWSVNRLSALCPDPDRCMTYEAANQTAALVRALEGRSALTPFIPGSVEMPGSLKQKIGCRGWLSPAI